LYEIHIFIAILKMMQGIRLSGLKLFKQRWRRVYENMTTSHVSNFIVRPLTARRRGSLCDAMLQHPRTSGCVAQANWFLSHTWQSKFSDTVDAVLYFFEGRSDASDVVLWFDVFSAPQHQSQEAPRPPSWWMNTFKSSIERMGSLVLVVDSWSTMTSNDSLINVAVACNPFFSIARVLC
jgi:hypothetical protein